MLSPATTNHRWYTSPTAQQRRSHNHKCLTTTATSYIALPASLLLLLQGLDKIQGRFVAKIIPKASYVRLQEPPFPLLLELCESRGKIRVYVVCVREDCSYSSPYYYICPYVPNTKDRSVLPISGAPARKKPCIFNRPYIHATYKRKNIIHVLSNVLYT